MQSNMKKGFTLIEMLTVVAIFFILSALVVTPFVLLEREKALSGSALILKTALSEARSKTVAAQGGGRFGVHAVSGEKVLTLFQGDSYNEGDSDNVSISLNSYVEISSVDLDGASPFVLFEKISGETNQSGEIVLVGNQFGDLRYATVTIFSSGVVE